ncbi:MAG TPA: alpha/beta hydrolase [Mycobacteriales bacterium]|nr:alpha/beta hydrolase [Mycobacteriales bacterium]
MSSHDDARLVTTWIDVPSGPLAVHDLPAASSSSELAPVVLLPGYTGGKEDFSPIASQLTAAGRRFVAVDLRGQHESIGPDDRTAYAVDTLAADVVALCHALGEGPVHLVGHSFGGLVARAAVLQEPAAVRSLVLLCSGPGAIGGGSAARTRALAAMLETHTQSDIAAYRESVDAVLAARPEAVRTLLRSRFVGNARAGLLGMGDAILSEPDRVDALQETGVPVLVTYGSADDAWEPAVQASMAQRLGAAHAIIDGAGHSPAVDAPDETARVLTAFWVAIEAAPASG